MQIPKFWAAVRGEATDPEGKRYALRLWGWSQQDVADALSLAQRRLRETISRITSGAIGDDYAYGRAPLREEIVRTIGEAGETIITRNRYGALVLNTTRLPFIDVDTTPAASGGGLLGFFKKAPAVDPALERIRAACARNARHGFRIYKTSAGYRVIVTTGGLEPQSSGTEALLKDFGSDPAFIKLCRLQSSFRARLTPKPWRIDCPLPSGQHPREGKEADAFRSWLSKYEAASDGYAACRFLESTGARPSTGLMVLVEEHDRICGAESGRPLA
jgi:hypothetical protein